ncbi:hypothetical protein LCM20_04925 [Halobacillus litoralis]|uniref:hypothetical protein n=1 Tax=Halobacillus litoralis TaxID=45668 RepID=UPI001CD5C003|nr:hypothetical protein [Halobacillus litoralis]MCA0969922.1 hypothetical protein [Halobacillus litoralis]
MTAYVISFLIGLLLILVFLSTFQTGYDRKSTILLVAGAVAAVALIVMASFSFNIWITGLLGVAVLFLLSVLLVPRLQTTEDFEEDYDLYEELSATELKSEEERLEEEPRIEQEEQTLPVVEDNNEQTEEPAEEESTEEETLQIEVDDEREETLHEEATVDSTESRVQSDWDELDFEDELLAHRRKSFQPEPPENKEVKEENQQERNLEELIEWGEEPDQSQTDAAPKDEKDSVEIDMDDYEIPELDLEEDSETRR